jgi:protein-histidine N-methyltransferase
MVLFHLPLVSPRSAGNLSKIQQKSLSSSLPLHSVGSLQALKCRLHRSTCSASTIEATCTSTHDELLRWCIESKGLPPTPLEPTLVTEDNGSKRVAYFTTRDINKGESLLEIPGDIAVTTVDVEKDDILSQLAQGRSELVSLSLWLMRQRSLGTASDYTTFVATLPISTLTPILWTDDERKELLRGSPVLEEANDRRAALQQEWTAIQDTLSQLQLQQSMDNTSYYNETSFLEAMSVILATASYLPSAQCFAMLPILGALPRTGSSGGALLDYDLDKGAAVLTATRPYSAGQEVMIYDGRPNGELLLATGTLEPNNPADFLTMRAGLVPADKLYTAKKQVLTEMGYNAQEVFPIYSDRIAVQQLAYLRFSRIQDPAQLASVTFDKDVIISVENEYEILQLMMADLRDALQAYAGDFEEDVKVLQRRDLSAKERVAAVLRLSEKQILGGTMTGVRKRLAPIRGIPTKKGGMQDPNADLLEIFDTIEAIPAAPKKLLDGIMSWAKGEQDPDWKR